MDRQAPSDPPVFDWGDFDQSWGLLLESEPANIASLLSARSYLLPGSYPLPNAQSSSTPSSLRPGDLGLEQASSSNQTNTNQATPTKPMAPRPGAKKARPAKDARGAPSKENPEQRRRMQTRVAQRAYRSRQQAMIDGLKNRISLLETSMEKTSSAMLSFSEKLVQSGVLKGHSALTTDLRDTMKVFHTTASGVVALDDDEFRVEQQQPRTLKWLPPLDDTQLSHPANSARMTIIEVSAFIQQLLLVALYQSHLALRDTSIGMDQLRRPFGLLLSMMNRERLTSYFNAELHSLLSQKPMDGWDDVPFFRLGGAGTHYANDGKNTGPGPFVARHQSRGTVEDPLSLVGADLQTQLEGDWFDLQDLEGYIREKNVLLVTAAGEPAKGSKVQASINVFRFITALVTRGVCLGRSPGFQRKDVEFALCFSKVA